MTEWSIPYQPSNFVSMNLLSSVIVGWATEESQLLWGPVDMTYIVGPTRPGR